MKKVFFIIILLLLSVSLTADDADYGYVKLLLNRKDGSFSLSYLLDPVRMVYEPVFYNKNPATTFITAVYDGNFYKLGESKEFTALIATNNGNPALVFESDFMVIIESFSPVTTPSSDKTNGVKITFDVINKRGGSSFIGLRLLFDTHLGEERKHIPFITNNQLVTKEIIIDSSKGDYFWLSRGKNISIMGSIIDPLDPEGITPSYLHIANWKRLNSVLWDLKYEENRSFHNMPYSVRDSAVCYYYNPILVAGGESFSFSIYITTEDIAWFNPEHPLNIAAPAYAQGNPARQPPVSPAPVSSVSTAPVTSEIVTPVPPPAPIEQINIVAIEEPVSLLEEEPVYKPLEIVEIEDDSVSEIEAVFVPAVFEIAETEPETIELDIQTEYLTAVTQAEEPFKINEISEIKDAAIGSESEIAEPHDNLYELLELHELQNTLRRFIAGDIHLNEEDLLYIESSITRLKSGL